MIKKISVLLVFVLVVSMAFMFTGCSNKSVEASKAIIDKYYEAYADFDADDTIDLLHEGFIEVFESEEDLKTILLSRMAVFGEIQEYKVVGTSYYKNNGEISVTLDVDVTYKRSEETLMESFDLVNVGEEMAILEIYHENERPYDDIPTAFFDAYSTDNKDEIADLFSNALYEYITEETLMENLDSIEIAMGKYQEYELAEEWYVYAELEEEDVVGVYEGVYDVSYEDGTIALTIQLCIEDDEIKIYDIFWSGE